MLSVSLLPHRDGPESGSKGCDYIWITWGFKKSENCSNWGSTETTGWHYIGQSLLKILIYTWESSHRFEGTTNAEGSSPSCATHQRVTCCSVPPLPQQRTAWPPKSWSHFSTSSIILAWAKEPTLPGLLTQTKFPQKSGTIIKKFLYSFII